MLVFANLYKLCIKSYKHSFVNHLTSYVKYSIIKVYNIRKKKGEPIFWANDNMLKQKQIDDIIKYIIKTEFEKGVEKMCSPTYYKNVYLEYAIKHHKSLQCIVRTYAEMLNSGYAYTHLVGDRKHANRLVSYLNVYSNTDYLEFVNQCFDELKEKAFEAYSYLILTVHGRLKSFLSLEVKLRKKILSSEILSNFLENYKTILCDEFWNFEPKELEMAKRLLLQLKEKNHSENPIRDLVGYRGIVDSVNVSTKEEDLIDFIYDFSEFTKHFFEEEKGFDILESKDYIQNPKDNNYQSYHFRIELLEKILEVQIRTSQMHENAENGTASHNSIYKNTTLQKFLEKFLYEISGEKVPLNERLGLLKPLVLPSTLWCFIPNQEIPATPADLKEFADMGFLEHIFQ